MWTASQSKEQTTFESQQENGASELQPQGTGFYQQPDWAWKQSLPQRLQKSPAGTTPWFWPHETLSRGSSLSYPDSQLTETVI